MSDLIIDRGLRDKILQPDWEDILGSIVSTTDIEDYGDYAIIDNFIDKIDELAAVMEKYPADAREKLVEASHREFGEFDQGFKMPGITQLLPTHYFTPLLFACYKSFIECEFIPHDLDANISEQGKVDFLRKLPNLSSVQGQLMFDVMIVSKNANLPNLGNFDFHATLILNDPPEGCGISLWDIDWEGERYSSVEDLLDIEDKDVKSNVAHWMNENAVCKRETEYYTHFDGNEHFDRSRFVEAKKNRLILHKGTIFVNQEFPGGGDFYFLNVLMNTPPKPKELDGNEIGDNNGENF